MKLSDVGSLGDNVQYHRTLSSAAWHDWNMIPEVRTRLLQIAAMFVEYLDIEDFTFSDIVLTGSLANFNYTPYSDFDLHVVTDYKALKCDDLAEALYRAKKQIWNDQHDITIHGHEVELYVEDVNEPPVSAGMFSIQRNRWIDKPGYVPPKYDAKAVKRKAQGLIDDISKTIRSARSEHDFKAVLDKLRRMRRSGLDTGGEFSTENLAFKLLRNQGWLDRLNKAHTQFVDTNLTLK